MYSATICAALGRAKSAAFLGHQRQILRAGQKVGYFLQEKMQCKIIFLKHQARSGTGISVGVLYLMVLGRFG